MLQPLVFAVAIGLVSSGIASTQTTSTKVVIPITSTSPIDGKQMFTSYCSGCHGMDGKGRGALVPILNKPSADLTSIAKNHGGRFPENYVISVLEFGAEPPENRCCRMSAWGGVFASVTHLGPNDKDLRMLNMVRYLESIQAK